MTQPKTVKEEDAEFVAACEEAGDDGGDVPAHQPATAHRDDDACLTRDVEGLVGRAWLRVRTGHGRVRLPCGPSWAAAKGRAGFDSRRIHHFMLP